MSSAWARFSARPWRRLRLAVLNRDGWVCQICHERIDPSLPNPNPGSAQVHHTLGRGVSGDDPRYLVAAHRGCNLKARTIVRPRRVSSW